MNVIRNMAVAVCALVSIAAHAQTTNLVEIVLSCPNAPRQIVVVFDGEPMQATRVGDTNRWRGDRARSFDAKNHIASARVGGGRTGCARSKAHRVPGTDQYVAQFELSCVEQRIWPKLQIDATPLDLPVTYARVVPGPYPCTEKAQIGGAGVLADVGPVHEMLYLHPGNRIPRYFEQYFLRIAPSAFIRRLEGRSTVVIKSTHVLNDITMRSGRNSPNQRELARKDLDKTGFKTVVLKVQ